MKIKQKGAQGRLVTYIVMGIIGLLILYFGLSIAINEGHPMWTIALIVITAVALLSSLFVKIKNLTIVLDEDMLRIGTTSVKYKDIEKVKDEGKHVVVKFYNVDVGLRLENKDKEDFIEYLNEKMAQAKEISAEKE